MQDVLVVAFALAALLNAATAVAAWRRRSTTPAAGALTGATVGLACWSAVGAPLNLPLPRALHDVLLYASFPGILASVIGFCLLSRFVADPHFRPGRWLRAQLVGVPPLILAAVATDPWHHLVFTRITAVPHHPWFVDELGPLFWAHAAWCYALLVTACAHAARAWWHGSALVRTQLGTLLLAGVFPLAGNLVVLGFSERFSGRDLTPLFFTATAALTAVSLLRNGLLQVVPVARAAVLDTVQDHVVVVDDGGTVVDVNPAGRAYLQARRPDLPDDPVGVAASEFLSPRALGDLPGGHVGYVLEYAPGYHLDVQVSAITDRRGRPLGRVVVARDITELIETRHRLEEQVAVVEALRAQLAEDVVRDPLTGLHNRRHFEPAAAGVVAAASAAEPAGVLVVDLDHFKDVNDTHGHAAGDAVLVEVARALGHAAREGDLVARTGGEEFALVLRGAGGGVLARRAEELRAVCAALEVPVGDGRGVRPTVSIGTAAAPHDGATLVEVLAAADRALYLAKARGRDRVVAAP